MSDAVADDATRVRASSSGFFPGHWIYEFMICIRYPQHSLLWFMYTTKLMQLASHLRSRLLSHNPLNIRNALL